MLQPKHTGNPVSRQIARRAGDVTIPELAPAVDWSALSGSKHFAQFYETDDFLLQSLSSFVGAGLGAGEACIVVATQAHREELDRLLQETGLNPAAARTSRQLVVLDAAETLSQFMVDGAPDPARFAEVIGGIVARAAGSRQRVRIFGEMVALLWAEGNHDGAIRLEVLWNTLQATHAFVLFCAYPMDGFAAEAHAGCLGDVCMEHALVIPAESYTGLASPDDRLRAILELQQKASLLEGVKNELEVQVEDLSRLHEISLRLTRTLEIEPVLEEVLQAALAVQGTSLGLLSLCDPERDGLTLKASSGFDDAFLKQVEWVLPGAGACGNCYEQRRRIVVEDVEVDPIFAQYRDAAGRPASVPATVRR